MEQEEKSEGGGMRKIAAFIVDKRNLFFLLYVVALVFCLFSRNWVEVENDITTYLPEETETRRGLTVMNDNFITYGSARVMITNVTQERAQALADQVADLDGVSRVTFDSSEDHYRGTAALLDVSFDGTETDQVSIDAMEKINELLEPYDGRMIVELLWGLFETTARLEDAQDRAAMHKLALLMAESLNLDSWIAECGLSKP